MADLGDLSLESTDGKLVKVDLDSSPCESGPNLRSTVPGLIDSHFHLWLLNSHSRKTGCVRTDAPWFCSVFPLIFVMYEHNFSLPNYLLSSTRWTFSWLSIVICKLFSFPCLGKLIQQRNSQHDCCLLTLLSPITPCLIMPSPGSPREEEAHLYRDPSIPRLVPSVPVKQELPHSNDRRWLRSRDKRMCLT